MLALTGCGTDAPASRPARPARAAAPAAASPTSAAAVAAAALPVTVPTVGPAPVPMPASIPVRVDLRRIGVDAPLMQVTRGSDGNVETPPYSRPTTAGWFNGSVTPGQTGTAVIVGHVDTRTGPAVFYPLSTSRPGDLVDVRRADRTTAEFTVDSIQVIPRESFDESAVYGSTGRPELRLITCGGTFDKETQEYSSNVVVFAHLTRTAPGGSD